MCLLLRINGLSSTGPGFFLIKVSDDKVSLAHIKEWETFFSGGNSEVRIYKCYNAPSNHQTCSVLKTDI